MFLRGHLPQSRTLVGRHHDPVIDIREMFRETGMEEFEIRHGLRRRPRLADDIDYDLLRTLCLFEDGPERLNERRRHGIGEENLRQPVRDESILHSEERLINRIGPQVRPTNPDHDDIFQLIILLPLDHQPNLLRYGGITRQHERGLIRLIIQILHDRTQFLGIGFQCL